MDAQERLDAFLAVYELRNQLFQTRIQQATEGHGVSERAQHPVSPRELIGACWRGANRLLSELSTSGSMDGEHTADSRQWQALLHRAEEAERVATALGLDY